MVFMYVSYNSEHISEDQYNGWFVVNRLSLAAGVDVYEWTGWRQATTRPLRWVVRHSSVPDATVPLSALERLQWQPVAAGSGVGRPRTTPAVDDPASQTAAVAHRHDDPRDQNVAAGADRLERRLSGRHGGLSAGRDSFVDAADSRSPGDRAVTVRQRSLSQGSRRRVFQPRYLKRISAHHLEYIPSRSTLGL